jgi:flagellin
MVVQHNLTAMNSNRMLGLTTASQAKSTERLSSGYKINRAADDAAGLSISEKMRKQIRGLTQASSNAEDGISAVQTAEGALTEVHDMLQRMNELAVKSANGTNSETDRSYIQSEVDQLVTEIDRVSTTTKFNETYLLKGTSSKGKAGELTFDTASTAIGSINGATVSFDSDGIGTVDSAAAAAVAKVTTKAGGGANDTKALAAGKSVQVGDDYYYLYTDANDFAVSTDCLNSDSTDSTYYFNDASAFADAVKAAINEKSEGDVKELSVSADGKVTITAFADLNNALDVSLHVGADSSKDNKITLDLNMMSARGLGINGIKVDGDDATNATAAIDTITDAIQKVSQQRSTLGAVQNRLEHTVNNLDNIVENTTSAESAIRDTDMATEMVRYSNNNILAQAGQAMLAQANQSNQGVLSLLG